jgi:phosphonate transport system substrate-binding protein
MRRGCSGRGCLGASVLAFALAALPLSASALDARFVDADGDLVADAPKDPKQWVDPATLIFAYTPVEDPAVYVKVWEGFLKHLETVTGKKVQFFPVQSNAAQLEAMRAGRLHVTGFNTGSNPIAVNCAGFVPFAMMASKTGDFGYAMEIITYPGSGIEKIEDIKGKKLAFASETSNSGYKAPSAFLRNKYEMEPHKDYQPVFSGKHDNTILGVANKDYPAGSIASVVKERMIARGVVKADAIKVLYRSELFPTTGYGYVYNLKPELADKVKEAFFSFNWDGTELAKEFGRTEPPMEKFISITYKKDWTVVREIDAAMSVSYACK